MTRDEATAGHDHGSERHGSGFTDLTDKVRRFVHDSGIESGLLTLFVPHTSASLLIQENADPDVLRDLDDAFGRWRRARRTTGTRPKAPTTCRPTSGRR